MSITDERRAELVAKLESTTDNRQGYMTGYSRRDARDILAMLKEGEVLPWKVHLISSPSGQGYYPPELMATCRSQAAAEHVSQFWGMYHTTVTGPDDEEGAALDAGQSEDIDKIADKLAAAAHKHAALVEAVKVIKDACRVGSAHHSIALTSAHKRAFALAAPLKETTDGSTR